MALPELERDYNMTDADLCMFTSNLVQFMTRDAAEFGNWGVDAADITALQTLGDEFEVFPTDEEFQADVSIAVEDKDAKVDSLRISIRYISTRAENKWGDDSARYKKFGVIGMNKMNDRDLLVCARRVVHVGTGFLADLSSEGLTQQMLDDLLALAQEFENSLNVLKDAIADRDIKTEERRLKGNELYSFVVKYCSYGKQIWENVSEAKYNDYVIYPTGSGGGTPGEPPAAPELSYSPDGFHWDAVPTATSYQLVYRASDATEWLELYSGPLPETSVPFEPGNGEWIARLRARNADGYGDWSEERTVIIGLQPPVIWELIFNPSTNKVTLQWHASIGAEFHDVYQSVVPLGSPAGAFTLVQSVSGQVYWHDVTTYDVTEYYYVIARNSEESSEPSDTVSVDVPAAT